MGHVDALKAVLLGATLCAWVALAVLMLRPGRTGAPGNAGCALAFLGTAALTRLTFTEVETRVQITAFGVAAALFVARQVAVRDAGPKLQRWASCMAGTVVGAVVVREVVHHYLERWL